MKGANHYLTYAWGWGGGGGLGDFTSPLSKQTIMHIQVYNVQARKTVNFIFLQKQILYGTWVRGVAFYIILPVYFHERTSNLYVTSKHNLFLKMCIYKLSPLALVELILHTSSSHQKKMYSVVKFKIMAGFVNNVLCTPYM